MVAAVATTSQADALAELNALHVAMSSSLVQVGAVVTELRAERDARDARARRRAELEAEIARDRSKAPGVAGLGSVALRAARRARGSRGVSGLGDGAGEWALGQGQKINDAANQGFYSLMLEDAMRLVVAPSVEPEAALADPVMFDKLARAVTDSVIVPGVRMRALAALASMRASVQGEPSEVPFDRDEYDAAVRGDRAYIAAHAPDAGFFTRAIKTTAGVVATLDRYVPGWTILLDIASPVLPIAPLVGTILSAVPFVGGAGAEALTAVPFFGRGGLAPLSPTAPLSYGAAVGTATVQATALDAPLSVVTGRLGAVKFLLTKSAAQAAAQGLGVVDALEKVGVDLLDGYALAAQLVSLFVSPATEPLVAAMQSAIAALQAGVTLVKTIEASNALKKAADRAKAAALVKARQEEGVLADLERTLAALKGTAARVVASAPSGFAEAAALLAGAWLIAEVFA